MTSALNHSSFHPTLTHSLSLSPSPSLPLSLAQWLFLAAHNSISCDFTLTLSSNPIPLPSSLLTVQHEGIKCFQFSLFSCHSPSTSSRKHLLRSHKALDHKGRIIQPERLGRDQSYIVQWKTERIKGPCCLLMSIVTLLALTMRVYGLWCKLVRVLLWGLDIKDHVHSFFPSTPLTITSCWHQYFQ